MAGRTVLALPIDPGPGAAMVLPELARAISGEGPALLPVPGGDDPHDVAEAARRCEAQRAGSPLGPGEDDNTDPTALVLATSGSTGDPKGALLPASALAASGHATHGRLGGPGTWLLAMPAHHIAGVQVLLRAALAGTSPEVMDLRGGFTPAGFAAATSHLFDRTTGGRAYTALVPTQLSRLLDAGGDGLAALAAYDGVLIGGAATAPSVLDRARAAGVAVVTTYGMSETCGGCVYDGRPLLGVQVRSGESGRIELGGDVVARGYRDRPDDPAFTHGPDGVRWFRTDDLGEVRADGRLVLHGRADDVIVTGGLKVTPAPIEATLAADPGIAEVVVFGVPDPQWGERVVAAVVPAVGAEPPPLWQLHRQVADLVAPYAAPRQLLLLDAIPLRGPGKPDRAALRRLAQESESG